METLPKALLTLAPAPSSHSSSSSSFLAGDTKLHLRQLSQHPIRRGNLHPLNHHHCILQLYGADHDTSQSVMIRASSNYNSCEESKQGSWGGIWMRPRDDEIAMGASVRRRRRSCKAAALKGAEAIANSLMELKEMRQGDDNKERVIQKGVLYRMPPKQLGNPLNFYLPPVPCSTPARLHPLYHVAREQCDTWLLATLKPQSEAYRQFLLQSMHPLFVCLTMPDARPENILPLCKLIAWLFVVDNFTDELQLQDLEAEKAYYDYIVSLLEAEAAPGAASSNGAPPSLHSQLQEMSSVLSSVWSAIATSMSPRMQRRFIATIKDVFDATLTQTRVREEQGVVDLDTYLSFRKYTGEGYVFMIMAEYGNGLDLDDDVLSHPDIIKLQELVAYHNAYANDLLSFRKEFCLGHYQNLPSILSVHEDYNMQEAIFKVCRMIQALDDEFVSLRKKVMKSELGKREGVGSYLEMLGYVMSGFLEWAYQTGRYHGLNNHLTLRHGFISLVHLDLTLITQGSVKSDLFAEF